MRYDINEISFTVPDGFADRSLNIFVQPTGSTKSNPQTIVVAREERTEEPFNQQVSNALKTLESTMRGAKVLGQRERSSDTLHGREARLHFINNKVAVYQRHFFVQSYEMMISFVVTSTRAQSTVCDSIAEKLLSSLRLRKE